MKEFQDKIAVITGAASGIGRSIAERCAREGMKVVLADIEEPVLAQTEAEMKAAGANVTAVLTDVSKFGEVEALAQRTLETYGAVHLLCNNAGVAAGSTVWETTLNDWEWVLGVNLRGVIHGIRAFVPVMLDQDTEGHIVNTASAAGLVSFHPNSAYQVTKHAVVALSEKLHYDLALRGSKIKASVLCPGWVRTRIMDSQRTRPAELQNDPAEIVMTPEKEAALEKARQAVETGMSPDTVADHVFQAIREEQVYILPHPELTPFVKARMEAILKGHNPLPLNELATLLEE